MDLAESKPLVSHRLVADLRYELVTLGDELLLGLTQNSHLTYIGSQLARHGVMLKRNVTVTDDADIIAEQFKESWSRSDVVITTGGLGPTCDDRTRESIASVLGLKLVFDKQIEKAIEDRFVLFGRKMTPNNLKQAYRFDRGEVLFNANGTAPGLWVEIDGKVLCMLPGPTNELKPIMTEQVIPRLAKMGYLLDREAYIQIRTAGVGESLLETKLQPLYESYGNKLSIAYCAHAGQVDCRLSSPSGDLTLSELQTIADKCAGSLGEDFMCFGHDSLAKVCADMLRAQNKKVTVIENATGGLLASAFTDLSGATKFFAGSSVCYSNESKMLILDMPECILLQHGAVSDESAVALAIAAAEKFGADYALSTTGFSGPCSGEKENPVGLIYIGLYTPHGVWAKKISHPGPRQTVATRTINGALDWLRRELIRSKQASDDAGKVTDATQ
jgi:nicotinamide-nucleotide amidase